MTATWRIRPLAIVALLALAALLGALYTTAMASGGQTPPSPPPPPASTPTPDRPPMTLEEEEQARAEEAQKVPGRSTVVSGPLTKGSTITVVGKDVQMPADALVNRYIVQVLCVEGFPCPDVPLLELKRGNSTIAVTARAGVIVEEDIAPGEEGAFDFLKEVLP